MNPEDFEAFFHALHDYPPFPWQSELARQVATEGRWPPYLCLPTSSGKTAAIDVAIFALALQEGLSEGKRTAALRTFFVIDRRIVVDEAFERARRIAGKLRAARAGGTGILRNVADRLARFTGDPDGDPLHVARLRGGMYRDGNWAKSPVQPTVCVSTVDQVGSRLLFRGYGVSEYQRAIHAGLVGNDSLIIVDEAHLSQPFLETLKAVERYCGERWAERPPTTPFQMVCMSATPRPGVEPFTLTAADREDPELGQRLAARKISRLVEVGTDSEEEDENRRKFVQVVAREALALAGLGEAQSAPAKKRGKSTPAEPTTPANVIGVIVNRVATARMIFDLLRANPACPHAILLTGRIRPYDRDELLYRVAVNGGKGWLQYMAAEKNRPRLDRPFFVVATQTVEVGANVSFDALATEAAPLDALRQRFGRLDRLGERRVSHAVIVARKDHVAGRAVDPIYGSAVAETWKWLNRQGKGKPKVIDFGLNALKPPEDPEELERLCSRKKSAPVMLPAHVDALVQTSPVPAPDPEISFFLHGPASGPADVQIVWRADLPVDLDPHDEEAYISTVALVPPTSMEALAVPIYAARAWLARSGQPVEVTDLEGGPSSESDRTAHEPRRCIRWRGPDDSQLIAPEKFFSGDGRGVRPGDTLVVPATYGGADRYGWNPDETSPVCDVGDDCARRVRLLPVLRLHPALMAAWQPANVDGSNNVPGIVGKTVPPQTDDEVADWDAALTVIRDSAGFPGWLVAAADWLARVGTRGRRAPIEYPHAAGSDVVVIGRNRYLPVVLVARNRCPPISDAGPEDESAPQDFTTQDDTASLTDQTPLSAHCQAVKDMVRRFAQSIGLASEVVEDIALAGWFHDVGKADPRFQVWLHEGNEVKAAAAPELLAKSGMSPRNRAAIRWARKRARYPAGGRHEFLSVALLAGNKAALAQAHDPDLVLHLVGTHHGRGRPFVPVVADPDPVDVSLCHGALTLRSVSRHRLERLDMGWPDRFWAMVARYGPWGLAHLETIIQLADHRCSEEGQQPREGNERR